MRVLVVLSCFLIFAQYCSCQRLLSENITVYDRYEDLRSSVLERDGGDTIYVVNFWATWCGPCVKELPYFYDIDDRFPSQPIKTILVSLDFSKQLDSKLLPFVREKNIPLEIVVLTDPDSNSWIDAIDSNWSGAIPYTYIYNKAKHDGIETSFHNESELDNWIRSFILK